MQLLYDSCHDLKCSVRLAASETVVEMMKACPSLSRKLFNALLYCCGSKDWCVRASAKEEMEAALKLCPDLASEIVLAMMQFSDGEDSEREATKKSRKRQTGTESHCVPTKTSRLS